MKEIDLTATPPEPADAIADRISAAAELTGYTLSQPDERTLRLDRVDTPFWLAGILAPLVRRRELVLVTMEPDRVTARGHGSAAMVGFLEAYCSAKSARRSRRIFESSPHAPRLVIRRVVSIDNGGWALPRSGRPRRTETPCASTRPAIRTGRSSRRSSPA